MPVLQGMSKDIEKSSCRHLEIDPISLNGKALSARFICNCLQRIGSWFCNLAPQAVAARRVDLVHR